jgi:FkbM family methyltransferase
MQFFNSIHQIIQSEGVNPAVAICRHLSWQARRAVGAFPCELRISHSILRAQEGTGVAALVNAMGMYDFHNMSLLRAVLAQREATFVDVGSNIGSYTVVASESDAAFVVSIEPHPSTFACLTQNVRLNGRHNVACFNLALSNREGLTCLTSRPHSALNRVVDLPDSHEEVVSVRCRTLDGLCAELNICADIVKIDVEGHEYQVIDGFRRNLAKASLLIVEDGERSDISSTMKENGLLGPLYFHQRESALKTSPQRRAEDPIYLSDSCLRELGSVGIAIRKGQG